MQRDPRVWSARASHAHSPSPFLHSLQTFRSNIYRIACVRKKYDCFAVYWCRELDICEFKSSRDEWINERNEIWNQVKLWFIHHGNILTHKMTSSQHRWLPQLLGASHRYREVRVRNNRSRGEAATLVDARIAWKKVPGLERCSNPWLPQLLLCIILCISIFTFLSGAPRGAPWEENMVSHLCEKIWVCRVTVRTSTSPCIPMWPVSRDNIAGSSLELVEVRFLNFTGDQRQ